MSDQTPLDVEAIRARLDATSPGMTVDVRDGGSTLRATANTTNRPGFVGAIGDLVETFTGGSVGPVTATFVDDEDGQDATFALNAANDIRDLLDENARLNAENDDMRKRVAYAAAVVSGDAAEMLAESLAKVRAELDRVIREAAADKAKIGEPEEEWAIRVVADPGRTYWYHNESDGENPEQDLAVTLEVLANGRDLEGNPVPHGPVSIVKRTVWSTEWETVERAPEMPRPPAVEASPGLAASERPETRTEVSQTSSAAQACDDCWFSDVAESVRPAHWREAAAFLRSIADENGVRLAADILDNAAPSLPVPSTEEADR